MTTSVNSSVHPSLQYSITPLDVPRYLKSQIKNWTPSTLNQLPVHPGTGWYTLWYTLKVQKTQCLSALVRVVHLKPPWVSPITPTMHLYKALDFQSLHKISQNFTKFHKISQNFT